MVDGQSRLTPNAHVDVKARQAARGGGATTQAGQRTMNFSELFIRRPVMTMLVMAGILVFGITAYRQLPVSDLPTVDFPTITVNACLPGASPETMASAVATPLEKQFSTIAGIDNMTSIVEPRLDVDHASVRARPQHRRGRAGRAGGDRARRCASCRRASCRRRIRR